MTACHIVLDLPIGSHCTYGFVFKDYLDQPIALAGSEFVFTALAKATMVSFDTTGDPANLYIEENVTITPVGSASYTADRLVLALTPTVTRQFPLGALTNWEIEYRKDGEEHNWGNGKFNGYGGLNTDV